MIKNVFAFVAVTNLEQAEIWYDTLFDRAPDTRPMDNLVEWKFPDGGMLQVYVDARRAGYSSITLMETNVSRRAETVRNLGIKINSLTSGDKFNLCIIRDPDENQIVFAQPLT